MIRLFDRDITKLKIIFLIIFGVLVISFALYAKSVLEDLELIDTGSSIPVYSRSNISRAILENTPLPSNNSLSEM